MNALDIMPFGRNKGYQIGMVYLFDPGYINWALAETDKFCITDMERLEQFKPFVNPSTGFYYEYIDLDELNFFIHYFDFTELLYLGSVDFKFSEKAKMQNQFKLKRFGQEASKPYWANTKPEDQIYFYQLLDEDLPICELEVKYMGKRLTQRNFPYYLLTFDNSKGVISFLPHCSNCKLALLKDDEIDIEPAFIRLTEGGTYTFLNDNQGFSIG